MYLNHEPWFQAPYLRCLRLLCLRSRRKGEDESLSAKRKRKVFKSSSRSQPLEINLRQHHLSLTPRRSSPSQNCCCKNLVFLFVYLIRCNNKNCQYSRYVREFNIKKILWNVTYQLKCLHCTNLGARSLTDDPGREELLDSFPLFLPPFPCMGEAAALRLPDGGLLAERGWDEVGGREPGKTNK